MKFNWGTGLVVAIVAFIAFIMYFVITMSTDKKFSHDLVTEQYYQEELVYQAQIIAQKNAEPFKEKITTTRVSNGLEISIPEELKHKNGKVFLYRPSNKQLDFEMSFSKSNPYLLVPDKRLVDGRWNITIIWKDNNKDFIVKKAIIY